MADLADAEQVAQGMSADAVAALPRAALDAFGPHPLNPPHRHEAPEELAELVASIKARGVLSPAIVVTRSEIVRRDPDMADRIDDRVRFVFLDGHRRWGASRLAEVADIPYIVRDDLADPRGAAEVFLASNIHRQALSPMEEARGYDRLAKVYGKKQEELAASVGVSQSRVSKALQLLKLPTAVQQAIDTEQLSAHAARELITLPAARRESTYRSAVHSLAVAERERPDRVAAAIRTAVKRTLADLEDEKARAQARETLRHEHVTEIQPDDVFGVDEAWLHELGAGELDQVGESGGLAGAVVQPNGRIVYYSNEVAPRHQQPGPDDAPDSHAEDAAVSPEYSNGIFADDSRGGEVAAPQTETRAAVAAQQLAADTAHQNRVAAIRRLLADRVDPAVTLDIVADATLGLHHDVEQALVYGEKTFGSPRRNRDLEVLLATQDRAAIHRTAMLAALATLEAEASQGRYSKSATVWPAAVRRHVQRLAAMGYYTLTDYDNARLKTESEVYQ